MGVLIWRGLVTPKFLVPPSGKTMRLATNLHSCSTWHHAWDPQTWVCHHSTHLSFTAPVTWRAHVCLRCRQVCLSVAVVRGSQAWSGATELANLLCVYVCVCVCLFVCVCVVVGYSRSRMWTRNRPLYCWTTLIGLLQRCTATFPSHWL